MVSVTVLLTAAATFWGSAAPGIAQNNCPDGVRYNVLPRSQMINQGRGVMAEAKEGGCVITFRAGILRSQDPQSSCALVIHEYGHAAIGRIAGGPEADEYGHAPSGIMAPRNSQWGMPGICKQFKTR